jgi:hypothetical protein
MPGHDPVSNGPNFKFNPGQPAFLEVSIDPAAHGEKGLGPIKRGVNLQTTGGQNLKFELTAQVVS